MSIDTSGQGSRSEAPLYALPLIFVALVFAIPFGVGFSPIIFRDGDASWHIAAGRWMLEHRQIPSTDPFSFTAFGHPWIDTEWLAEIVYSSAFNAFGYSGLAVVVAAALIALNAIIFFYLQRRVSPVVTTAALLALNVTLGRFVLARPHVLAWPFLAGWTVLLLISAENGRPPKIWWVCLLTIWANLHASFVLAIPIAAAIGLDSLIETRWKYFREWLVFALATALSLSLNANGLPGLLQPLNISTLSILPLIGEWKASTLQNSPLFYGLFFGGLGMLLWANVRFPIGRLLLLLVMLALAFDHVRHQSSFAIIATCVIPTLWRSQPLKQRVPHWAVAGALPLLIGRALVHLDPPENNANPWRLIAAIPGPLKTRPVFNEYTFGGPLILSGVKVYIDGRAEMYGDHFVQNYADMTKNDFDAFRLTVKRFNIQWLMLPMTETYLLRELRKSRDWCGIYQDRIGIIAVKKSSASGNLCAIRRPAAKAF